MLKIAVCDDSPEFLERAEGLINRWAQESGTPAEVYRFDNGDALLAKNAAVHMDVVFLDIIMPLLNGMDAAKELRKTDAAVKIVFLTSSPEFALASYEVKASGYLLKPVDYERIRETLEDCRRGAEEPKSILVKTDFGYQRLSFCDIECAEAQNKRVTFHLRTGKSIRALEALYSLELRLTANDGFFKCHRSYIVYLANVDHFNMSEAVTKSGRSVPIARGCGKAFQEAYFAVMFRD